MKRNVLVIILCLIFAGIAVLSGYKIVTTLLEYKAGRDAYQQLQQYVNQPENTKPADSRAETTEKPEQTKPAENEEPAETTAPVAREPAPIQVDFAMLQDINSDVVGWIYLEDSQINFPVAQGEDNSEYLYWLINGDYNGAGTPFMDYRNARDFSDRHTIIYGHNMNNGTMFADIHKYVEQEYFDTHPVFWILTPAGDLRIEVFAGYITGVDADAWQLDFESDGAFAEWVEAARAKSSFVSSVIPGEGDRILTLSTCSNSANKTRFVLLGIIR